MSSICRSCLSEVEPMAQIDDTFRSNYYLFTNIQIKPSDGLSQESCMICAEMVASFIIFREKCIQAENYLQQSFDNVTDKKEFNEVKLTIKSEHEDELFEDTDDYNEHFLYALEEDTVALSKEVEIKLETDDIAAEKPILNRLRKRTTKVKVKNDEHTTTNNTESTTEINKDFIFDKKVLGCGICKKSFKLDDHEQLKEHIESHRESRECEICLEGFSEWPQLVSHRIKHIPRKQCYICKKNIKSVYVLEHHYRDKHTDSDKRLKCSICLKEFDKVKNYKKHLARHKKSTEHCSICNKSVIHLARHMVIHGTEQSFDCKICAFQCKTRSSYHYHMAKKHGGIQCSKCKRLFLSQVQLDQHLCKISTFICAICGKEIKSKRKGFHMKSHAPTPAYKCKFCPAEYRWRNNLKMHEDKHNKKPRHECEFCKRKFYGRNCLLKHRRIHTGEKPHVCTFCNKGFTATHNLRVHMKVHGLDLVVKRKKPEDVASLSTDDKSE